MAAKKKINDPIKAVSMDGIYESPEIPKENSAGTSKQQQKEKTTKHLISGIPESWPQLIKEHTGEPFSTYVRTILRKSLKDEGLI